MAPAPVVIGEKLSVQIALTAERDEAVALDLMLCKPGQPKGRRYKVRSLELTAGSATTLTKVLTFKGDATTYRLGPGSYRIDLRANGKTIDRQDVTLV